LPNDPVAAIDERPEINRRNRLLRRDGVPDGEDADNGSYVRRVQQWPFNFSSSNFPETSVRRGEFFSDYFTGSPDFPHLKKACPCSCGPSFGKRSKI
jgi:hypothetical protein